MSYENCTKKLVVSSHKLNASSSRSHAIFTVELECYNQQEVKLFTSRLILVDLAGSEKIYSSIKDAKTKEESININRSLFSLRKVIVALSEGKSSSHVPFRDSKLTCLLKQSLGDFSNEIGCITATEYFAEDNLATLSYAFKANNIVNSVKKHEDPGFDLISKLRHQIEGLQDELSKANKQIEILGSMVRAEQKTEESDLRADSNMFDRIYEKIDNIQSVNNSEVSNPRNIASKFLETMDLFKSLLIANQELRDEMTQQGILLDQSAAEKRALIAENQDLREQLLQARALGESMPESRRSMGAGQTWGPSPPKSLQLHDTTSIKLSQSTGLAPSKSVDLQVTKEGPRKLQTFDSTRKELPHVGKPFMTATGFSFGPKSSSTNRHLDAILSSDIDSGFEGTGIFPLNPPKILNKKPPVRMKVGTSSKNSTKPKDLAKDLDFITFV